MKRPPANGLIVIAIVVAVAGVAWFRSNRATRPESPPPAPPAVATTAPRATDSAPATHASQPAVADKLPRVVDLGAEKCKACKDLAPILAELKKEYEGRVVVEFIDVWKNPQAGEPYKISVIPTQIFFDRDGNEVWRHVGFLPKADFLAKFAELGVK